MILLPWRLGMGLHDGRLALQSSLVLKRLGILNAFARSAQQDKDRLAVENSCTP